jgi:hypothetical protein
VLVYPGKIYVMVNNRFATCSARSAITVVGAGRSRTILGFAGLEVPVTIAGSDGSDFLSVNDSLAANRLAHPPFGEDVPPIRPGTGEVSFNGGAGDDAIEGDVRLLNADLGAGNDTVRADATSRIQVAGGEGRDEVIANGKRGAAGPWAVDLGPGGDTAKLNVTGLAAPPASSPDWSVSGGPGDDVLTVARGRVDCGAGSRDFIGQQLGIGRVKVVYSSSCPPLVLRRDTPLIASPGGGPSRIVIRGVRSDRRSVARLSIRTSPPRKEKSVELTGTRRVAIPRGARDLALPLNDTGRRVLRNRAKVRVLITLHALRATSGGDRLLSQISMTATLRRR